MNQAAKEGLPNGVVCEGTQSQIPVRSSQQSSPGQSQLGSQHASTNSWPSQCSGSIGTHQHDQFGRQLLAGMAQRQPVRRQRLLRLAQQRAVAGQLRLSGRQLRQGGGLGLLGALQAASRIGQLRGMAREECIQEAALLKQAG